MELGYYLYCITSENIADQSEIKGIDSDYRLTGVRHEGLNAIISPISLEKYSEEKIQQRVEDLDWVKDKAKSHMDILLKVMESAQIIPFRFLTIFHKQEDITKFLKSYQEQLLSSLDYLEGKEEWSWKLYCDKKAFVADYVERKGSLTSNDSSPGANYFKRKMMKGRLQQKAEEELHQLIESIYNQLDELSIEHKLNQKLAQEITGHQEEMLLNFSLLVEAEQKERLGAYTKEINETLDRNIHVEFTGPWPAYDYCPDFDQEE
ncbi:GvpL/GvpF family gas vesicle protein [Natroniella sulfidigena]|uniref:GvpL/GvpF family gas vesicle protein n=1 Tax=Natroniella sulfidigena TaxID=723921 RepID=UPI002009EF36|nr:GvpL/GvpF family gas vesicle protein [Natroniella sulfidigena]MCK8817046.1 GvpL/GvpF family gas vesicle protein [Natroniella sulfidigena]